MSLVTVTAALQQGPPEQGASSQRGWVWGHRACLTGTISEATGLSFPLWLHIKDSQNGITQRHLFVDGPEAQRRGKPVTQQVNAGVTISPRGSSRRGRCPVHQRLLSTMAQGMVPGGVGRSAEANTMLLEIQQEKEKGNSRRSH